MATEPRQRPPGQFSGRFIRVIALLSVAYAIAMWFTCTNSAAGEPYRLTSGPTTIAITKT